MEEAIRLYLGINETKWNHHPVMPGPYVCISPVYGRTERTKKENNVSVPKDCWVLQDSGAFCDGPGQRLSFEDAHLRQLKHAEKFGYAKQVTHRASYDLLIDEKWDNGIRYKKRWTVAEADMAVKETISAAQYLRSLDAPLHLQGVRESWTQQPAYILSAQGVDAQQYLSCVQEIVPLLRPRDILGMGGWCITGRKKKKMLPEFLRTIRVIIPYIGQHNVHRVHVWGVLLAEALGPLLWICDQYEIQLSTDSSGPSWRPAFGEWGYAEWRDNAYSSVDTKIRGIHRKEHVQKTREWLNDFRSTQWYKEPLISDGKQEVLF